MHLGFDSLENSEPLGLGFQFQKLDFPIVGGHHQGPLCQVAGFSARRRARIEGFRPLGKIRKLDNQLGCLILHLP